MQPARYFTSPSPSRIDVRLDGAAFAAKALKELEFKVRRRILSAAVRAGNAVLVREAKQLAPVGATGMLKKQIRGSVKLDTRAGIVYGTVRSRATKKVRKAHGRNAARYAHLVIGGTRPHEITPAAGSKALATPTGFYTRIQHPGTKPQPFMEQAADRSFRSAVLAFDAKLEERLNIECRKLAQQQQLADIGKRF